jgi:hypothetical protein
VHQTDSEPEGGRASRRDVVLLELERARARRRARDVTVRLPTRLPLPTETQRRPTAG